MELFIDESGDLGGTKSNKRYFIVAGVICNEKEISFIIKSLLQELNLADFHTRKRKRFHPSSPTLISV